MRAWKIAVLALVAPAMLTCAPEGRDYPDDVRLELSPTHDICTGAPHGTRVQRSAYGIDSQAGHVHLGSQSLFYYVGFGVQLEQDPRPRRRTDLPGLSHDAARVHRWEGRETAAVVVEGLTKRHGGRANVWYQYDRKDPASRRLAEGLAAHTDYCRNRPHRPDLP